MNENNVLLTRDDVIAIVKEIWAGALQRDDFNLGDHFLDLGGDSLAAMLCISRIREKCDVELTFEDFFMDYATVIGVAKIIADERKLV